MASEFERNELAASFSNEQIEALIRKHGRNEEDAQSLRLEIQQRAFRHNRERAIQENPGKSVFGSVLGGLMNYGEQAGLGLPSTAAAAMTAPITAYQRGVGMGDAYELNKNFTKMILNASPVAAATGRVGAVFAPTPARAGANIGAYALGSRFLAGMSARARDANAPVRAAAFQIFQGITGAMGATAAIEGTTAALEEDSVAIGAERAMEIATNPLTVFFGAAGGSIAATSRAVSDPAVQRMISRARRRIPGFRPTAMMSRDPKGFLGGVMESLGNSAAGRSIVSKYMNESFYTPLRNAIDVMRGRFNVRTPLEVSAAEERAASGVRALLPDAAGSGGQLREKIREIGDRAFGEVGDQNLRRETLSSLITGIAQISRLMRKQGGKMAGSREPALQSIFTDFRKGVIEAVNKKGSWDSERRVTMNMLDSIRQRLAPIAQFDALTGSTKISQSLFSGRDIREAKKLYGLVTGVIRSESGVLKNAYDDIATLRKALEKFGPVANVTRYEDDAKLINQIYGARDFSRRWRELETYLPPERLQALRGWYLASFFEKFVKSDAAIGATRKPSFLAMQMEQSLGSSGGLFRRSIFDQVFGGRQMREAIVDMGRTSDLVKRTIGRAEGSATARRQTDLKLAKEIGSAGATALSGAANVLTEPGRMQRLVGQLLGAPGLVIFTNSIIKPNGRIGLAMQKLSGGKPFEAGLLASPATATASRPFSDELYGTASGVGGSVADALLGIAK